LAVFCVLFCMTCSFGFALVWLGIVFSINAERHLAKAEGSKCKERGITQPLERERKGPERSGGLHGTERSAVEEAWGDSLRARGGWPPRCV
jgi:hypothetical protein